MPRATINNCYQKCKKQGYYEPKVVSATRVLLIDSDTEIFFYIYLYRYRNIWSHKNSFRKVKKVSFKFPSKWTPIESCRNWPHHQDLCSLRNPFLAFCEAYCAWYYSLMVVLLCKGLLELHKSIGYGDRKSWGLEEDNRKLVKHCIVSN